MKKIFLTCLSLLCVILSANAQSLCSNMATQEAALNAAANKYLALTAPTAAEDEAMKRLLDGYKTYFEEIVKETFYTQKSFASVLSLKALWMDMTYLERKGDYRSMVVDAAHGISFFNSIDDAYDHEMECRGGGTTTKLNKYGYRQIMSGFLSKAVQANLFLGREDEAMQLFMLGLGKDCYGHDANVYKMSGAILSYRLQEKLLDDTTYWAAYFHLYSSNAELSLGQVAANFGNFHEADAIAILSDPKFEKRKLATVPSAGQFAYSACYGDLLDYLSYDTTGKSDAVTQQVVRLLVRCVNANGDKHFPLYVFVQSLERGHICEKIAAGSDKELMKLLADFIADTYHKPEFYNEYYGAYLLYHAAGEEKKANKVYNRLAKGTQERFKKLSE